jgi:hypothetical protein
VNGANGVSSFTTFLGALTLPAKGAAVVAPPTFANVSWAAVGQTVFGSDGTHFGTFVVTSTNGTNTLGLTFLGATGDSAQGQIVASGAILTPTGAPQSLPINLAGGATVVTGLLPIANVALAGALPTAITDNSGGAASAVIAAGAGQFTHTVHFRAAAITANVLVYTHTFGFAFKIIRVSASIVDAITTGAKAATLTTAIAGTPTTGGVVTLAGAYAVGVEQASASSISALNTGTNAQAITVTASGVTPFTEGGFDLHMQIQNLDTANAIKSLSTDINSLITAL